MALLTVVFSTALFWQPVAAERYPYPHCLAGESPRFQFGLAALSELIGARMGQPVECEHSRAGTGDRHQLTTTGLAYWRQATNTPTFTDGWDHWALTPAGLIYWAGLSIDPPRTDADVPPRAPMRRAGIVREVVSGDLVHVQFNAEETALVSAIGISAPTVGDPGENSECFSRRALERTFTLLPPGQPLVLELDPVLDAEPGPNRPAHIFLPDGSNFAELMLRGGYVRMAEQTHPHRYIGVLVAAQEDARAAGSGLWSACYGPLTTERSPDPVDEARNVVNNLAQVVESETARHAGTLPSVPAIPTWLLIPAFGVLGILALRRVRRRR